MIRTMLQEKDDASGSRTPNHLMISVQDRARNVICLRNSFDLVGRAMGRRPRSIFRETKKKRETAKIVRTRATPTRPWTIGSIHPEVRLHAISATPTPSTIESVHGDVDAEEAGSCDYIKVHDTHTHTLSEPSRLAYAYIIGTRAPSGYNYKSLPASHAVGTPSKVVFCN
ncbi:unnamed protein product [Trichogramma brassicae]|uniref:Uncharacterized protein n=1 Tax=Trichogramma brassicae TaxID=86971 RepID=A0A6H5IMB7_9HYME|nr:unnamed protein product [Trichogramma brassicae]